jgi:predicted dehydrogenase
MGRVHTEAIRRLGNVEVAAVAAENDGLAAAFAQATGVEKTVTDYHKLLEDPQIEAVHICTPNALHYPIAKAAMLAGKHVLCEKPLAISSAEARELVEIARKQGVANCLNHNLRFYPLVQQARAMIQNGELGEILVVQGTYSQDWLLYDTDWNWRVVAQDNGPLRVMGDIGSHWMDTIMHLTGLEITALCADLQIFHKTRKRPKVAVETFAGKTLRPEDFDEVPIETEDFGAVLLRLGGRARGAFTVSQVNAGCKNRFQFEIYGSKAGVIWNQETPDQGPVAAGRPGARLCRPARRAQRGLRRRAQNVLPPLLRQGGRPRRSDRVPDLRGRLPHAAHPREGDRKLGDALLGGYRTGSVGRHGFSVTGLHVARFNRPAALRAPAGARPRA